MVGEAAHGEDAVRLAQALQPDVVVMDLHMPGLDGIEATRRVTDHGPRTSVPGAHHVEDDDTVFAALRAGARATCSRAPTSRETLRAIRAVGNGEAIFGPGIAPRGHGLLRRRPARAGPGVPRAHRPRDGAPGAHRPGADEPGDRRALVLSLKTVRNHVSNICGKLQVADRAQAVIRAREAGLGRL